MNQLKRHTPSPAMIVALVALFVALGGAAYAGVTLSNNSVKSATIKNGEVKTADLANSAVTNLKLKNNSVNSAKVKNGTLEAADLSAAAKTALKGNIGPAGAIGPSNVFVARETDGLFKNLPQNTATNLGTLNVPAGKYLVWAKLLMNSNDAAASTLSCTLTGSSQTDNFADGLTIGAQGTDDREMASLMIAPDFATPGTIDLTCTSTATAANAGKIAISATQTGTITETVIP